jgi:hypothetical protein
MSRSKVDPVHIQQYVYDEELEAYRVHILPTEIQMELNAEDGDSVICKHDSIVVDQTAIQSCVGMKTVCLYGAGTVSISPDDTGSVFYDLALTALVPVSICARRVKIVGTGKLVLQSI